MHYLVWQYRSNVMKVGQIVHSVKKPMYPVNIQNQKSVDLVKATSNCSKNDLLKWKEN